MAVERGAASAGAVHCAGERCDLRGSRGCRADSGETVERRHDDWGWVFAGAGADSDAVGAERAEGCGHE